MTGRRYTLVSAQLWSSEEEHRADALAPGAEEGRDKLRKAAGRSTCPLIRGQPNGVTRGERSPHRAREEDSAAGPDRAK